MNSLYISLLLARFGLALRVMSYEPLREYAGKDFFSGWDISGSSTSTIQHSGTQHNLTFVNHSNGHAIIRVENTTKIDSVHHNSRSIKITTTDTYSTGNLILIDAVHVPRFGRSVQPSFSLGELDLMGGIQNQSNMARLQTDDVQQPQPQSPKFLKGSTASNRCGEPIEREAGEGDSGVFALQIDVERVSMWFWGSQDIPFSISQAKFREGMSVDISDWRGPSAVYPAVGHGQKLALGVTLCGDQAGEPEVHTETCLDPGVGESQCNHDPNSFTSAYWEISYIRTFTLHAARRKAGLFARAESGTNTTSSVDLLPSIHRSINIGPPHPTLFNPTVATTATSHSDGHHVIAETRQGTVPIFNPTITWTDDQRSTQAESAPVTFSIFNPVITDTQVDTAVSVTTSTSETGHTETDTVDITTAPTSSSEPTAEVASTVVDVTLASGSVRSVTLTVGEGGVGVVGATTTVNSVGFGVSGSTSTQTDATPPSGSTASSNAGSVARFGVDLLVVGFIFSVFAVNCCV